MASLYDRFYKMVTGENAPYEYGGYTIYDRPQPYAMDMSQDGRPSYWVPNDQVGIRGVFNRMLDPRAKAYAEALERNRIAAEEIARRKNGQSDYVDYNPGNTWGGTAYAGERRQRE